MLLSNIADFFTIVGVIVAVVIYIRWKRDYNKQKCSEYALELLKKIKLLHQAIENLRAPKFYHPERVENEIEEFYIPKINELIISKVIEINNDLLIAKNVLLKNKNLLDDFNKEVLESVIRKIQIAINTFYYDEKDSVPLEERRLFKIIFPSENRTFGVAKEIKRSILV